MKQMELPTEGRSSLRIAQGVKPATTSPTTLTMQYLRGNGFRACKAEYWQATGPTSGIRRDLFGFIDVVGLSEAICGFQVTSLSAMPSRVKKIRTEAAGDAQAWLQAGGKIFVHGWGRYQFKKVDGQWSSTTRWLVKIKEITWEDFSDGN